MILLSMDTCDVHGSVAVLRDGGFLAERTHEDTEDYSSWLIPAIHECLHEASLGLHEVDVYVVASGPGSFTGLRVGLATVKAFSEVYHRPVAAISRLAAIASQAAGDAQWIAPIVDAGRGEVFAALYRRADGGLRLEGDELVLPSGEFFSIVARLAPLGGVAWVAMNADNLRRESGWMERERAGEQIHVSPIALAPVLGRIGYQRALAGNLTDALALDADYVRRSDAERFWKDGPRTAPDISGNRSSHAR